MEKRKSGSYQRGKQPRSREKRMRIRAKSHDDELEQLIKLRDDQIDTSDIPEVKDWAGGVIGRFYRPIKEPVTVRIDADILAWLKSGGPGYQTRINALLREAMRSRRRPAHPRE